MYYHQIGSYETKCDGLREVANRNKVRLQNGVMANRGLFGSKTTEPKVAGSSPAGCTHKPIIRNDLWAFLFADLYPIVVDLELYPILRHFGCGALLTVTSRDRIKRESSGTSAGRFADPNHGFNGRLRCCRATASTVQAA